MAETSGVQFLPFRQSNEDTITRNKGIVADLKTDPPNALTYSSTDKGTESKYSPADEVWQPQSPTILKVGLSNSAHSVDDNIISKKKVTVPRKRKLEENSYSVHKNARFRRTSVESEKSNKEKQNHDSQLEKQLLFQKKMAEFWCSECPDPPPFFDIPPPPALPAISEQSEDLSLSNAPESNDSTQHVFESEKEEEISQKEDNRKKWTSVLPRALPQHENGKKKQTNNLEDKRQKSNRQMRTENGYKSSNYFIKRRTPINLRPVTDENIFEYSILFSDRSKRNYFTNSLFHYNEQEESLLSKRSLSKEHISTYKKDLSRFINKADLQKSHIYYASGHPTPSGDFNPQHGDIVHSSDQQNGHSISIISPDPTQCVTPKTPENSCPVPSAIGGDAYLSTRLTELPLAVLWTGILTTSLTAMLILSILAFRYRRRKGRTSDFRNDVPGREIIYEDLPVNHGGREQTVQEKCSQGVSDSNIAKTFLELKGLRMDTLKSSSTLLSPNSNNTSTNVPSSLFPSPSFTPTVACFTESCSKFDSTDKKCLQTLLPLDPRYLTKSSISPEISKETPSLPPPISSIISALEFNDLKDNPCNGTKNCTRDERTLYENKECFCNGKNNLETHDHKRAKNSLKRSQSQNTKREEEFYPAVETTLDISYATMTSIHMCERDGAKILSCKDLSGYCTSNNTMSKQQVPSHIGPTSSITSLSSDERFGGNVKSNAPCDVDAISTYEIECYCCGGDCNNGRQGTSTALSCSTSESTFEKGDTNYCSSQKSNSACSFQKYATALQSPKISSKEVVPIYANRDIVIKSANSMENNLKKHENQVIYENCEFFSKAIFEKNNIPKETSSNIDEKLYAKFPVETSDTGNYSNLEDLIDLHSDSIDTNREEIKSRNYSLVVEKQSSPLYSPVCKSCSKVQNSDGTNNGRVSTSTSGDQNTELSKRIQKVNGGLSGKSVSADCPFSLSEKELYHSIKNPEYDLILCSHTNCANCNSSSSPEKSNCSDSDYQEPANSIHPPYFGKKVVERKLQEKMLRSKDSHHKLTKERRKTIGIVFSPSDNNFQNTTNDLINTATAISNEDLNTNRFDYDEKRRNVPSRKTGQLSTFLSSSTSDLSNKQRRDLESAQRIERLRRSELPPLPSRNEHFRLYFTMGKSPVRESNFDKLKKSLSRKLL